MAEQFKVIMTIEVTITAETREEALYTVMGFEDIVESEILNRVGWDDTVRTTCDLVEDVVE